MTRQSPVSVLDAEVYEFNLGFLELIRDEPAGTLGFGLDGAVRQRIASLSAAQLETLARTRCLLAGFGALPPRRSAHGVSEGRPYPAVPSRQAESARLFAASLLAWLWHAVRRDDLVATLCIGPDSFAIDGLNAAAFRDLQRTAALATECLEARFCRNPRIWPDLVRAAATGDPQLLTATRLSVVQLSLVERVAVPRPPPDLLRPPGAAPRRH